MRFASRNPLLDGEIVESKNVHNANIEKSADKFITKLGFANNKDGFIFLDQKVNENSNLSIRWNDTRVKN